MKDYKATSTMQAKRERAIGLLKALGIWRGQADCKHVYRNSQGEVTERIKKS